MRLFNWFKGDDFEWTKHFEVCESEHTEVAEFLSRHRLARKRLKAVRNAIDEVFGPDTVVEISMWGGFEGCEYCDPVHVAVTILGEAPSFGPEGRTKENALWKLLPFTEDDRGPNFIKIFRY